MPEGDAPPAATIPPPGEPWKACCKCCGVEMARTIGDKGAADDVATEPPPIVAPAAPGEAEEHADKLAAPGDSCCAPGAEGTRRLLVLGAAGNAGAGAAPAFDDGRLELALNASSADGSVGGVTLLPCAPAPALCGVPNACTIAVVAWSRLLLARAMFAVAAAAVVPGVVVVAARAGETFVDEAAEEAAVEDADEAGAACSGEVEEVIRSREPCCC